MRPFSWAYLLDHCTGQEEEEAAATKYQISRAVFFFFFFLSESVYIHIYRERKDELRARERTVYSETDLKGRSLINRAHETLLSCTMHRTAACNNNSHNKIMPPSSRARLARAFILPPPPPAVDLVYFTRRLAYFSFSLIFFFIADHWLMEFNLIMLERDIFIRAFKLLWAW